MTCGLTRMGMGIWRRVGSVTVNEREGGGGLRQA